MQVMNAMKLLQTYAIYSVYYRPSHATNILSYELIMQMYLVQYYEISPAFYTMPAAHGSRRVNGFDVKSHLCWKGLLLVDCHIS